MAGRLLFSCVALFCLFVLARAGAPDYLSAHTEWTYLSRVGETNHTTFDVPALISGDWEEDGSSTSDATQRLVIESLAERGYYLYEMNYTLGTNTIGYTYAVSSFYYTSLDVANRPFVDVTALGDIVSLFIKGTPATLRLKAQSDRSVTRSESDVPLTITEDWTQYKFPRSTFGPVRGANVDWETVFEFALSVNGDGVETFSGTYQLALIALTNDSTIFDLPDLRQAETTETTAVETTAVGTTQTETTAVETTQTETTQEMPTEGSIDESSDTSAQSAASGLFVSLIASVLSFVAVLAF